LAFQVFVQLCFDVSQILQYNRLVLVDIIEFLQVHFLDFTNEEGLGFQLLNVADSCDEKLLLGLDLLDGLVERLFVRLDRVDPLL
jgi:hypothetical protein